MLLLFMYKTRQEQSTDGNKIKAEKNCDEF